MKKSFPELVRDQSRLLKVPIVVGSLIVAAGVLATYAFATYLSDRASAEYQFQTDTSAKIFSETITTRTANLEQILFTMDAYVHSKPQMTKADWGNFIRQSRLTLEQPYILALGYVDVVPKEQRDQYVQAQQSETTNFRITPAGERDTYTAIRYLEPQTDFNNGALGFDMYSEEIRRTAMSKARDNDTVALTSPVQLIQDKGKDNVYGVLAYYPVYQSSARPSSLVDRRSQIVGYTYLAFRPSDFISQLDKENQTQLATTSYAITDTATGISMTDKIFNASRSEIKYNATTQASVLDREWLIAMTAYQPIFQRWTAPGITFLLGIVASFAIGGAVTYLMTRRLIRLDVQHQDELQRTKDELLALTSHQLRTPASGVKQYIGMLLQGFVGELTPQQESIARKAFAANERQLETINQLLHVAKADADQLVLQKDVIDIVSLTRQVIDTMKTSIEDHESDVTIKAPKKEIYVFVDERYMRMVIENLISNALKYSHPGKAVKITFTTRDDTAMMAVRDYGVGIADKDISKLFKKFARIPNSLSRSVGGSGLGLFLAEQIMKAHEGDIEVESKLGRGSIFTLTFPIYEVNDQVKEI